MKLYNYWRSSSSWRVRIALDFKQLQYDYAAIDLLRDGGEQLQPEYRRINPIGQVPALAVEEHGAITFIGQSVAIIEYLEERYPDPPLYPDSLVERARARQVVESVNSGIQPLQNLVVLNKLRALGADADDWARFFMTAGLTSIEQLISGSAESFALGDQLTVADVYIVPQLYNARRYQVPLDAFPTLLRIEKNCLAQPCFQRTHPDAQPDAPRPG